MVILRSLRDNSIRQVLAISQKPVSKRMGLRCGKNLEQVGKKLE